MLDDSIFREFQSLPFEEQLDRASESVELRETLLMGEIFKCGKEIFGGCEQEQERGRREDVNGVYAVPLQRRYVYDYEYSMREGSNSKPLQRGDTSAANGIASRSQNNNTSSFLQYSADEISFTLSSEDKHSQKDTHRSINSIINNRNQPNPHISWKNHLVETDKLLNSDSLSKKYLINSGDLSGKNQSSLSTEKVGKWKKPTHSQSRINFNSREQRLKSKESSVQQIQAQSPIKIKDNLYKKTFDLSNHKISYFPDTTVKKRKAIFQQKTPPQRVLPPNNNLHLNYSSSYYPQSQHPTYLTPQKTLSTRSQIPLSQQITKNVYGRLKQEVTGNSFIKEFQIQQKKTQQKSQQIWRGFIDRSDNWMQKKKSNLIEKQARERYQMDTQTKRKDQQSSPSRQQQQYYSYVDMRQQQKPVAQIMKCEDKKFQPEYTFRLKNNKRTPQKSPQKNRQSSVQNCINKLKTQTQLLKVKLLSPLKSQIQDDQMLNHYKQINQAESKKLVRNFTSGRVGGISGNEFNRVVGRREGLGQLKAMYGDCIGDQGKK